MIIKVKGYLAQLTTVSQWFGTWIASKGAWIFFHPEPVQGTCFSFQGMVPALEILCISTWKPGSTCPSRELVKTPATMPGERLSGAKAAGRISPMPASVLPLEDGIQGGQRWFAMPQHSIPSP